MRTRLILLGCLAALFTLSLLYVPHDRPTSDFALVRYTTIQSSSSLSEPLFRRETHNRFNGTLPIEPKIRRNINIPGSGSITNAQASDSAVVSVMSDLNRFCTGNGAATFFGNSVSASWCIGEYTGTYSTSANEDVLLTDAETLLPDSGGTIDASMVTGEKPWTSGSTLRLTKPTHLILNGQISYTGDPLEHGLIWIDYTAFHSRTHWWRCV